MTTHLFSILHSECLSVSGVFYAGVSLTSQGSYLSSSSGVISPDSNRDSGSFEPCDIPEQMEPSESKGITADGMRLMGIIMLLF